MRRRKLCRAKERKDKNEGTRMVENPLFSYARQAFLTPRLLPRIWFELRASFGNAEQARSTRYSAVLTGRMDEILVAG
ncbi:unnamed protein product [Sphagnum jensenii]|uniref:Ribosomal protein S14 n=1 Tax=Sphagnum jensenii TaxID=128206 RepID=A0ABP0VNI6_9BRYO